MARGSKLLFNVQDQDPILVEWHVIPDISCDSEDEYRLPTISLNIHSSSYHKCLLMAWYFGCLLYLIFFCSYVFSLLSSVNLIIKTYLCLTEATHGASGFWQIFYCPGKSHEESTASQHSWHAQYTLQLSITACFLSLIPWTLKTITSIISHLGKSKVILLNFPLQVLLVFLCSSVHLWLWSYRTADFFTRRQSTNLQICHIVSINWDCRFNGWFVKSFRGNPSSPVPKWVRSTTVYGLEFWTGHSQWIKIVFPLCKILTLDIR